MQDDLVTVAKALSDPSRVLALFALRDRELCVCQLTELLQLAPSTVSKHLSVLKQAGLVSTRKNGRWVYYCRESDAGSAAAGAAWEWLEASLDGSKESREQSRRLERVLAIPLETLCAGSAE